MSKKFDDFLKKHSQAFEEAHMGISLMKNHILKPNLDSVMELVNGSSVTLTISPQDHIEEIDLNKKDVLKLIPKEQWQDQLYNLFEQTLRYTCGDEHMEGIYTDLPEMVDAFIAQFDNPLVFANSQSPNWEMWTPVTLDVQDMLMVFIDDKSYRYLLGIVGD